MANVPEKPETPATPATPAKIDPTAQMAAALIGTKNKPQDWAQQAEEAARAWAYHKGKPYPQWAYRNWKTEDLGPLPKVVPLPRRAVRRGARFLFGKGLDINCAGNPELQEKLREAWTRNNMPARAVALAERGAIEGGVVLKFAYDPDSDPQISIQTLSAVSDCRLYFHPHNHSQLLMARVQYPYYDAVQGCRMWYREEWTAQQFVLYSPIKDEDLGRAGDPDEFAGWTVAEQKPNPFGLIPLTHVKNLETDDRCGTGDLWDLWGIIDDLNLVWWQMKRSNQFDSELNPWIIDGSMDEDDIDKPVKPGQPVEIKSDDSSGDGDKKQARVEFPSGGNGLRDSMMAYAKELRKLLEEAAGTVTIDQAEVSNAGNLTQAVLMQLYQVLLETTAEKQKSYGQGGIEPFLESLAKGLQQHGVKLGVNPLDRDTFNVEIAWPAPFELTNDEKNAVVERIQEEQTAGYIPHDRAVSAIAQIEGIRDVDAMKDELKKEPKPSPTETALDDPTVPGSGPKAKGGNQGNQGSGVDV